MGKWPCSSNSLNLVGRKWTPKKGKRKKRIFECVLVGLRSWKSWWCFRNTMEIRYKVRNAQQVFPLTFFLWFFLYFLALETHLIILISLGIYLFLYWGSIQILWLCSCARGSPKRQLLYQKARHFQVFSFLFCDNYSHLWHFFDLLCHMA